jgi:predicted secreted protein
MIEISFIFGVAIYGIIWFLTLFMVLPFGVRSQHESGEVVPGSEGGAPVRPQILRKLGINTIVATVFFALTYWLLTSGALSELDIPFLPDFSAVEK